MSSGAAPREAVPPIWSSDTHKHAHYQQRELKQTRLLLSTLLAELRRATNHWFQAKSDDCFQLLVQTCLQILQHGLQQPNSAGTLRFIEDFEFLRISEHQQQQQHAGTSSRNITVPGTETGTVTVTEFLQQWIGSCLRTGCLLRCLQTLLADKELLDLYYQRDVAYLRQSGYATALFVCLTAIQLDQSSLLSQLEPMHRRRHRRTCSQPNFSITQRLHVVQEEEQQQPMLPMEPKQSHGLRRIKSLPCFYQNDGSMDKLQTPAADSTSVLRPRCQTYTNPRARWTAACRQREALTPLSGCSISTASSCSQVGLRHIQLINCDDIKIWTDQTNSSSSSSATPPAVITLPLPAKTHCVKRSSPLNNFLGNLFGSPPVYTSWYNKSVGQDNEASSVLNNFLPINGRKLDKRQQPSLFEGISMLDYNSSSRQAVSTATTTEPLDITGSLVSRSSSYSTTPCSLSSDSQHSNSLTNSNTNKMDNQSLAAFLQMSRYTHNNTELEKENAHFRISEACITAIEHVKWSRRGQARHVDDDAAAAVVETDTLLMPYVEQHNGHFNDSNGNGNSSSAEAVGLQLISRFKEQQLPRLVDLKCLVSEQDAPQQLLPMPTQQEQQQQHQEQQLQLASGLTRGTKTWAPPRQQIIFTEHPTASRSQLLTRQNYRCAGCGMHVTRQYQQHFRYCNYLGKYLCTGCHRNQLAAIPAKILQSWDFRSFAVSSFAYRLIEQMYTFPLFHVPDLNAQLYARQKLLARARRRRLQLKLVSDFIAACRFAVREQAFFRAVPIHIINDPDMWSMCDFVDVQNNSMSRSIEHLIALSEQHVYSCVLCTGRAFVCEYCKSRKLIYPWQRKVQRCVQCGNCAHSNCWKTHSGGICQRCKRLQRRQQQNSSSSSTSR